MPMTCYFPKLICKKLIFFLPELFSNKLFQLFVLSYVLHPKKKVVEHLVEKKAGVGLFSQVASNKPR